MDLKPNQNRMLPSQALRRAIVVLIRGVALIAAVTAICFRIHLNSASAALVFLIAIVLQSLDSTFWEASIVCVLATASLDWFFIDPLFTFNVTDPLDVATLVCLLIASVVVTRIQSRSRSEARESSLQRENMERLYRTSTELYAQSPSVAPGPALLLPFWTRSKLDAVCLFDQAAMELHEVGTSRGNLASKTRDGFISGCNANQRMLATSVCIVLRWVCMQPLGTPVVPEVYGSTHRSSEPAVRGPG